MLNLHFPDRLSPLESYAADALKTTTVYVPVAEVDQIRSAVWIDLASPLAYEVEAVERALGITLPNRADMLKIEASSRVYREDGATFMTVPMVVGLDSGEPSNVPVCFILTSTNNLITLRFSDPLAIVTFATSCSRTPPDSNALQVMVRVLELVIDRISDILERMGSEIDQVSGLVFGRGTPADKRLSPTDLTGLLRRIGQIQFVVNKVHDSLLALSRVVTVLNVPSAAGDASITASGEKLSKEGLKTLVRDIAGLTENSSYLTTNISFLLDAALGRISIEQNVIIKIFSIAAVVFLPPTLVGTIYGMNFEIMPELGWDFGYPLALVAMVISGILPYLYFKSRGWL